MDITTYVCRFIVT